MVADDVADGLLGSAEALLVDDGAVALCALPSTADTIVREDELIVSGHKAQLRVPRRRVRPDGVLGESLKGVEAGLLARVPLESGVLLPSRNNILLVLVQIRVLIYLVGGVRLRRHLASTTFLVPSARELLDIPRRRRGFLDHAISGRVLPVRGIGPVVGWLIALHRWLSHIPDDCGACSRRLPRFVHLRGHHRRLRLARLLEHNLLGPPCSKSRIVTHLNIIASETIKAAPQ